MRDTILIGVPGSEPFGEQGYKMSSTTRVQSLGTKGDQGSHKRAPRLGQHFEEKYGNTDLLGEAPRQVEELFVTRWIRLSDFVDNHKRFECLTKAFPSTHATEYF